MMDGHLTLNLVRRNAQFFKDAHEWSLNLADFFRIIEFRLRLHPISSCFLPYFS